MLARKKSDVAPLPVFTTEARRTKMLKQIDARAAHLEKLDADVREWEKKGARQRGGIAEVAQRDREGARDIA